MLSNRLMCTQVQPFYIVRETYVYMNSTVELSVTKKFVFPVVALSMHMAPLITCQLMSCSQPAGSGVGSARVTIPKQPKSAPKSGVVGVQRRNTFGVGDGSTKAPSLEGRTKTTIPSSGGAAGSSEPRR